MNKETDMTMKLNPYFEDTLETSNVVWSHDENSYQFNFDFTHYLCDKQVNLSESHPRILLQFLNDNCSDKQIYPLIINSETLGQAYFIIPDKILGYVGDVKASLTIDFKTKSHDLGSFYFRMKKSPIDEKMPELQFWVDEFDQAFELFKHGLDEFNEDIKESNAKVDEIKDLIEKNDVFKKTDGEALKSEIDESKYSKIFDKNFVDLKSRSKFIDNYAFFSGVIINDFLEDGETDITEAYKLAVAKAKALGNRKLKLLKGVYTVSETLLIETQFSIEGAGSHLTTLEVKTDINPIKINSQVTRVYLKGLYIKSIAVSSNAGILIAGNDSVATDRLFMKDIRVYGFKYNVRNEAKLWNAFFEDMRISKGQFNFYWLRGSNLTTTFTNVYSEDAKEVALYAGNSMQLLFNSCSWGGDTTIESRYMTLTSGAQVICINNNFEGATITEDSGAIKIFNQSRLTLINCAERYNNSASDKDAFFIDANNESKVYAINTVCASGGKVKTVKLSNSAILNSPDNSLYNPSVQKNETDGGYSSVSPHTKYLRTQNFSLKYETTEYIFSAEKSGQIVSAKIFYINGTTDVESTIKIRNVTKNYTMLLRNTSKQSAGYVDIFKKANFYNSFYEAGDVIALDYDGRMSAQLNAFVQLVVVE